MFNEEVSVSPAGDGSVAFGLMVEQAAVPASLVFPASVMLVATQFLLDMQAEGGADRWRILGPRPAERSDSNVFDAALGLSSRRSSLFAPCVHRFYKTSVLSLLVSQGRGACHIGMNGMAAKGTKEIARWGDSGACEIRWTRSMVRELLATSRYASMTDDARQVTAASYDEAPALIVDGAKQLLPRVLQCEKIWKALRGEPVVVSDADMDEIEPVLCAGLRLVSEPNAQQLGTLDRYVLRTPAAATRKEGVK